MSGMQVQERPSERNAAQPADRIENDLVAEMKRLFQLRDAGLMSADQFRHRRAVLLGHSAR